MKTLLKTTLLLLTAILMIRTTAAGSGYTRSGYYSFYTLNRVTPTSYRDMSNYKQFPDITSKNRENYINMKDAESRAKDYNKYFYKGREIGTGATFRPLQLYFRPSKYKAANSYWSPLYLRAYYDSYGYNFYTRKYSYYQNSPNDA